MSTENPHRAFAVQVAPGVRLFATRDNQSLRLALYEAGVDGQPSGHVLASWHAQHPGLIPDVWVYGGGRVVARNAEFYLPDDQARPFAEAMGLQYAPLPGAPT